MVSPANTPDAGAGELRPLKVRLPVHLHLRILQEKFGAGTTVSAIVVEALQAYFDQHNDDVAPRA